MLWSVVCAAVVLVGGCRSGAEPRGEGGGAVYRVRPIGRIHNRKGAPVRLEIFPAYVDGLHRLDLCSHVTVVWWFHRNDTPEKRGILKVHPRGNRENPPTGVFATHSPVRPNLIAITTCRILSVEGGLVTIDKIDAFDGTPILDLKSAGERRIPLKGRPGGFDAPSSGARS
jgi:tRNA-Thr(GGU) m(6)t(6)A37 methyltransferase TsaA